MVSTLVTIYFGSPQFENTVKRKCIKVQAVDPQICSILELVSPHFAHDF